MLTLEIINPTVTKSIISIHSSATVEDLRHIIGTQYPLFKDEKTKLSDASVLRNIYPQCEGRVIIADNRFSIVESNVSELVRSTNWAHEHLTGYGALPKLLDLMSERWLPAYISESDIDRSIKRKLFLEYCGGSATSFGKMLKLMRYIRNEVEHRNKISFTELGKLNSYLHKLRDYCVNQTRVDEILKQIDILLEDEVKNEIVNVKKEWEGQLFELAANPNRKDYVGEYFLLLSGKHEGSRSQLIKFNGTNVIFSIGENRVVVGKHIKARYMMEDSF